MAIDVSWLVEKRVIYVSTKGEITEAHIAEFNDTMFNLVSNGTAPVHIVADTTAMERYPTSLNLIRQRQTYLTHPYIGWIIIVNSSRMINFLANILTSVTKVNSRTVNTYEEAINLLSHLDVTLPAV